MNISVKNKNSIFEKNQEYDIKLYAILFVLFLALNKGKSHYNMLNSLGAMIFCFIKLSEICLRKWMKLPIKFFQRIFETFSLSQNIEKYAANER